MSDDVKDGAVKENPAGRPAGDDRGGMSGKGRPRPMFRKKVCKFCTPEKCLLITKTMIF